MYKLLVAFGIIASLILGPSAAMATPPPSANAVQRVPAWSLAGKYVISFDCTTCVPHNITINAYNPYTGVFSGSGVYSINPAYTWTVSGTVSGNQIAMQILYTGMGAGYHVDLTGTIAPDGTMSGAATDSSGGHFGWKTTSGRATLCPNHGQFVKAQDDKRVAAHSNLGMPIH